MRFLGWQPVRCRRCLRRSYTREPIGDPEEVESAEAVNSTEKATPAQVIEAPAAVEVPDEIVTSDGLEPSEEPRKKIKHLPPPAPSNRDDGPTFAKSIISAITAPAPPKPHRRRKRESKRAKKSIFQKIYKYLMSVSR